MFLCNNIIDIYSIIYFAIIKKDIPSNEYAYDWGVVVRAYIIAKLVSKYKDMQKHYREVAINKVDKKRRRKKPKVSKIIAASAILSYHVFSKNKPSYGDWKLYAICLLLYCYR